MTNPTDSIKKFKFTLMIGIIVLYVINLICFFIAWIIGSQNMNTSYLEVLSYFLAYNNEARIVYLIWYGTYDVLNILLTYTMVKNDLTTTDNSRDEVASKVIHCSFDTKNKLYIFCTLFHIPVNLLRLFAFFLLFNFNMSVFSEEHYVWTAIAMIGSTVCCFLLFVRRLCARVYILIHKWVYLVYTVNAITIILQIVFICLLPSAPDALRGTFELLVAVFIGIDPVYQISDLYCDYRCNTTLNSHHTKQKCSQKVKFLMNISKGEDMNSPLVNPIQVETGERIVQRA